MDSDCMYCLRTQPGAEHRGAWLQDYENDPLYPSTYVGTRYVSTYLYGPLGPIARTPEYDDHDVWTEPRSHGATKRRRGC